jgi:hypothetical protein
MEGFEVPIAAWRVHATAAEIYSCSGQVADSERHRRLSFETIMTLANSLPEDHSLRMMFLAAPAASRIIAGKYT